MKYGYTYVNGRFEKASYFQYFDLTYLEKKKTSKPGWAYSSSYKRELSQKAAAVFQSIGNKVRARFSRDFKPIDHLGGLDPEKRLLLIDDKDRELERWPKTGSTFENMDVCVY
jgi:hypothetical protein